MTIDSTRPVGRETSGLLGSSLSGGSCCMMGQTVPQQDDMAIVQSCVEGTSTCLVVTMVVRYVEDARLEPDGHLGSSNKQTGWTMAIPPRQSSVGAD